MPGIPEPYAWRDDKGMFHIEDLVIVIAGVDGEVRLIPKWSPSDDCLHPDAEEPVCGDLEYQSDGVSLRLKFRRELYTLQKICDALKSVGFTGAKIPQIPENEMFEDPVKIEIRESRLRPGRWFLIVEYVKADRRGSYDQWEPAEFLPYQSFMAVLEVRDAGVMPAVHGFDTLERLMLAR